MEAKWGESDQVYQMLCTGQIHEDWDLNVGSSYVSSLVAFTRAVTMAQWDDSSIGVDSREISKGEIEMSTLKTTLDKFLYKKEQRDGEVAGGRAEGKRVLLF